MPGVHLRTEDTQGHTQERIPCKDDFRDCSDAATSQGVARQPQETRKRQGNNFPVDPSKNALP